VRTAPKPRGPHTAIVEHEVLARGAPAELERRVVLLGRHGEADEGVVGIAEVLGTEAGRLAPQDGEALLDALEIQLGVAELMRARARGQAIDPVVIRGRMQEREGENALLRPGHR